MNIILIIIGMALIILNYIAIKKESANFSNVLKTVSQEERDYDLAIAEIRRDLADSIFDIQKDIEVLKEKIDEKEEKGEKSRIIKEGVVSEINFSQDSKLEQVKELISLNYSDEKICEKLSMGKGEVLLIRGLLK